MFMVYGVTGRVFTGSLEELGRVHAASRTQGVRRVIAKSDDLTPVETTLTHKPHDDGIRAYQQMVQPDVERGPLYHAYQIMTRDVITLLDEDDVAHAWRVLRDHKIHQSPVLNSDNKLVGVVSERDLLTAINIEDDRVLDVRNHKVKDVMTSPVVAAEPVTDIRRIAKVMVEQGVSGVPIVNDSQELVGFISRTDLLRSVVTDPPLSLWR